MGVKKWQNKMNFIKKEVIEMKLLFHVSLLMLHNKNMILHWVQLCLVVFMKIDIYLEGGFIIYQFILCQTIQQIQYES